MSEALQQLIDIEVVHAQPQGLARQQLTLPLGCTVRTALERSSASAVLAGSEPAPVFCFGRKLSLDAVLHHGDRLELLQPLLADPKDQRRQRVETARRKRRREAQVKT